MDARGRIKRGRWDSGWMTVQLTATLEHLDKMIWKRCCLGINEYKCKLLFLRDANAITPNLDSAGSVAGQVIDGTTEDGNRFVRRRERQDKSQNDSTPQTLRLL